MIIGIYIDNFHPESGGAHTFNSEILESVIELSYKSRHEFIIFYRGDFSEKTKNSILERNIKIQRIDRLKFHYKYIAALKYYSPVFRRIYRGKGFLEKVALNNKIELMWFVGTGAYEYMDIPFIATQWDVNHRITPFFPEVSSKGIWDDREIFYSYFLKRAAYCLVGTEVGKKEVEALYQIPKERLRVIPLPTPKLNIQSNKIKKNSSIISKYVIYPAQFWPHKNHINLIDAIKILREKYFIQIDLVCTGSDKGNMDYVKKYTEFIGLSKIVHFMGFVNKEELVELYRHAEALTFLSLHGPDNIPPLEAFSLGIPVITSDINGAYEQYGEAAILVDPLNPDDIAQAIANLLTNDDFKNNQIKKGFIRAKSWYANDYFKKILELFDEFGRIRRNWQ